MEKHLEYDKNCISKHRNARKKFNECKSYLPRLILFHLFQGRKSCVTEDLQSGIKLRLFSSQLAETSLSSSKIFQEAKRLKKSTYCSRKSNKTCLNNTENTHVHSTTSKIPKWRPERHVDDEDDEL